MRRRFVAFFVPFLLLYILVNYYIALRFLPLASTHLVSASWGYWLAFALGVGASFAARMHKRRVPGSLASLISTAGDYWLAAVFHALPLWVVADFGLLFLPDHEQLRVAVGATIALLLFAILVYGYGKAHTVRISRYAVALNKHEPENFALRAVLVSDLHLGTATNNTRFTELIERIGTLEPDIVFFVGDTIDGDIGEFAAAELPRLVRKLTPRFGCYAVFGNHEYIGGKPGEAARQLEGAGIKVLIDTYAHVDGKFFVVGRDDAYMRRRTLSAVMEGIDRAQPIILLDHQPVALQEAEENGVDLMLSGHTHHGQFFPNNLLTQRIFAVDWGYLRQGALQVIVSCGFGTWGPPIRTSGWSEIVVAEIRTGSEGRDGGVRHDGR